MIKTLGKNKYGNRISLLTCAVLLAASVSTPTSVKAEPSLTAVAVIGGAAVIGSMLWANRASSYPMASSTNPATPPAYVTEPYPAISPAYTTGAVIYSSVSPVSQAVQVAQPPQQMGYYHMAAAPIAYYNQPTPAVAMMPPQYAPQMAAQSGPAPQSNQQAGSPPANTSVDQQKF